MKILLASTSAEVFSGAAKCLFELAEELRKRKIEVLITLPKPGGDIEGTLKDKNIPYIIIREYQNWYVEKTNQNRFTVVGTVKKVLNKFSILKAKRIIEKEKIDLVHVNALTAYVLGQAAVLSGVPLIWHIREFMEEDLGIKFSDKKCSIKLLNQADKIIAISQPIKSKWKNFFKVPIDVINDGIPIENYYIANKQYNKDCIKIIIYGRITPGKGQMVFFQGITSALPHLKRNIHCYWAGKIEDNGYYQEICSFIKQNNLSNIVDYAGEVKDIKSLLLDKDISCICSKQEGFGRVTVESMLAGCLVIGADTGATREIIRNGENGYLYNEESIAELAKAIEHVVNNFEQCKDISRSAQSSAAVEYKIETNADKVIEVYKNTVLQKAGK